EQLQARADAGTSDAGRETPDEPNSTGPAGGELAEQLVVLEHAFRRRALHGDSVRWGSGTRTPRTLPPSDVTDATTERRRVERSAVRNRRSPAQPRPAARKRFVRTAGTSRVCLDDLIVRAPGELVEWARAGTSPPTGRRGGAARRSRRRRWS